MKGIILGALVFGVAGSAMARPELNAFINKPANSVPELIAQIKSDKQVADRFMRHFSMSKEEVLEFIETLRLGTLKESGYYTIYSAPENGVLKAHISFFKKGTPAFVDADGNAILRVKCANPFVGGPSKPYATSEPSVSTTSSSLLAVAPTSMRTDSISVNTPNDPPQVVADNSITLKTTPTTSSPQIFSGNNSIAGILGLGGAAVFVNKGGKDPVPEPASVLAISLGLGALLLRRKKK
jgi:hypothetical protein